MFSEVYGFDALYCEVHVPDAIGLGRPECDLFVGEGPADTEPSALEGDAAGDIDAAHLVIGVVVERRQGFGEGAGTGEVAADGGVQLQGMVGAFQLAECLGDGTVCCGAR